MLRFATVEWLLMHYSDGSTRMLPGYEEHSKFLVEYFQGTEYDDLEVLGKFLKNLELGGWEVRYWGGEKWGSGMVIRFNSSVTSLRSIVSAILEAGVRLEKDVVVEIWDLKRTEKDEGTTSMSLEELFNA